MTLSRKIKLLTMALVASVGVSAFSASAATTSPQISVQLWSIKPEVHKDFEGTMKKLKAMGFDGVEFAGMFGPYAENPAGLKAFLDKTGLKASSAHVQMDSLSSAKLDATVAFYKAIDCKYLIVPMDQRAFTVEGAKVVAAELEAIQKKLAPHGMQVGYHNHKPEMLGEEGNTPWDVIGANTSKEVILQQDVGWTESAGKDPIDFIKAYPGRTILAHYKAAAPEPGNKENFIIGKDTTDWKALITASKTVGGTLWFVIEQEMYLPGLTELQSVEASLKGLQKIIADMK